MAVVNSTLSAEATLLLVPVDFREGRLHSSAGGAEAREACPDLFACFARFLSMAFLSLSEPMAEEPELVDVPRGRSFSNENSTKTSCFYWR